MCFDGRGRNSRRERTMSPFPHCNSATDLLLKGAQPDDLCDIDIWTSMSTIYISIPRWPRNIVQQCANTYCGQTFQNILLSTIVSLSDPGPISTWHCPSVFDKTFLGCRYPHNPASKSQSPPIQRSTNSESSSWSIHHWEQPQIYLIAYWHQTPSRSPPSYHNDHDDDHL